MFSATCIRGLTPTANTNIALRARICAVEFVQNRVGIVWNPAMDRRLGETNHRCDEFFLPRESPVFMRFPPIRTKNFGNNFSSGVVSSVLVCYNKYVSERHYCRLRMRD